MWVGETGNEHSCHNLWEIDRSLLHQRNGMRSSMLMPLLDSTRRHLRRFQGMQLIASFKRIGINMRNKMAFWLELTHGKQPIVRSKLVEHVRKFMTVSCSNELSLLDICEAFLHTKNYFTPKISRAPCSFSMRCYAIGRQFCLQLRPRINRRHNC